MDIGEQAISAAAKAGIEAQLDEVDSVDVALKTDPLKLTQGQLDEVVINGRGMVVQNDLRTEAMTLRAENVDISMTQLPLGKVELDQPASAEAKVVLNAEDIQKAFASDFVKQKMRGQKVELPNGDRVTTDASNVTFSIPEDGRVAVSADVMLIEKVETHHVSFSGRPTLKDGGHKVSIEDLQYQDEANDMPELTQSLVDSTEEMLDLRNFELDNMELQFESLEAKAGQLVIHAKARITSFS